MCNMKWTQNPPMTLTGFALHVVSFSIFRIRLKVPRDMESTRIMYLTSHFGVGVGQLKPSLCMSSCPDKVDVEKIQNQTRVQAKSI